MAQVLTLSLNKIFSGEKKKVRKSECICVRMPVNFLYASPLIVEHITHFFAILDLVNYE